MTTPVRTPSDEAGQGQARPLSKSIIRYLIVGTTTVALDFGLLVLLHGVLHVELLPATAAAYLSSLVYNFTLHKQWSFQAQGAVLRRLVSYMVMEAFGFVSTLVLMMVLTAGGLPYMPSKLITAAIVAGANFSAYRWWIFARSVPHLDEVLHPDGEPSGVQSRTESSGPDRPNGSGSRRYWPREFRGSAEAGQ